MTGMALPGSVSSDAPAAWATAATATVATAAVRPATTPVRQTVGLEVREAASVEAAVGAVTAVIGAPWVAGPAGPTSHPDYERPPKSSTPVRELSAGTCSGT